MNIVILVYQHQNHLMKVIVALVVCIIPLLGWSDVGHMLVSRIAEIELLKGNPTQYNDFYKLIEGFNTLTDGKSNSFVEASVWPDDIKNYQATLFDNYQHLYRVYDPQGIIPLMDQQDKDINIVNTIGWALSILKKNKDFVSFDRAFMARFLLSAVGDIHQPLNTIQMYNTSKALLNGDKGGKLINITTEDNIQMTLSHFLDTGAGMIEKPNSTLWQRPLNPTSLQLLNSLVSAITTQYPKDGFGASASVIDPGVWAGQSYNDAVNQIYPYLTTSNTATREWTWKTYELCKKKIALAGYRLSAAILSIYA